VQLYKLALALCPGQPGTFAALGYTHQLMGNLPEAIQVSTVRAPLCVTSSAPA